MISINTDKKLNIILPNTNKALKEVLKDATPQELDVITKGKDLKSIIGSLLKESAQNSSADKTLLSLVKSNPTLKDLGSATQNLKELLTALKSDKSLLHVEKVLEKFMPDIKDIKNTNVKNTLENSGVFLESKLKNIKEPQTKLRTLLETLNTELQNTKTPSVKALKTKIEELLKNIPTTPSTKENPKLQESLVKTTQEIVKNISKELKNADPITTKEFSQKLDKLQHLTEAKNLEKTNFKAEVLKDTIKEVITTLKSSFTKEASSNLNALNKVLEQIKPEALKDLPKAINEIVKNIQETKTKISDKNIIVKLEKVAVDIKNIVQDLKTNIAKADPVHSNGVKTVLKELTLLNSPIKLSPEQNIKEILNNDLKAVLHKANEDVSKIQTPAQAEVLKHIDKLSLQIDYYQLVSHLSNSSSLYIPFSWEQMQDGEVSIKHSKDDKFYCDIELKLKEYGELNVRLTLYDKNQLNINIHSDSDEFKEIMKEAIPELRAALIDMQITPREIRVHEKNKQQATTNIYNEIAQDLEMGFEVRG